MSKLLRTSPFFAFLLFILIPPYAASAKPKDTGGGEIDKAVERGVQYLKGKQDKDGAWKGNGHETGATALAVYALLKANCPLADQSLSSGIAFLLNSSILSNANPAAITYEVSLTAVALAAVIERARDKKDDPASSVDQAACYQKLQEMADWLVAAQHDCQTENRLNRIHRKPKQPDDKNRPAELPNGGYDLGAYRAIDVSAWGYRLADSNYVDNSNTQFALLGLRAAQNVHDYHSGANISIPREVWEKTLARLVSVQIGAGEWDYGTSGMDSKGFLPTMTVAGVGGVIICLSSLIEKPEIEKIMKTPEIMKALVRLEKLMYPQPTMVRFDGGIRRPPDRSGYMLYSLERACMLGGLNRLGAHDWYAEGVADLLRAQLSDGSWAGGWYNALDSHSKAPQYRDNTIETSFCLLFLTKGYVYTPAHSPYAPVR